MGRFNNFFSKKKKQKTDNDKTESTIFSNSLLSVKFGNKVFSGNNVQINGETITIDNVSHKSHSHKIYITGDVESVNSAGGDVHVEGKVDSISTASGDVTTVGDVSGDISTMSGDVKCGKIKGNVSTMSGDVTSK